MDFYAGSGVWVFDDGEFTADMVGGTLTVASPVSELNGSFEITAVNSTVEVVTDPAPAGGPTLVEATSISLTYTPPQQVTSGAEIVGVSLIPMQKDGMDKLGSNKRAT